MSFKDPKTKLPEDSLILVNDVLKMLVLEAALRGAKQSVCDHRTVVELEQIEKILPQLVYLFFSYCSNTKLKSILQLLMFSCRLKN